MSVFKKFAREYFDEAVKDLRRAERAFELSDYPQSIFILNNALRK